MSKLNIEVLIAGKDQGAGKVIDGITKSLGGLGTAGKLIGATALAGVAALGTALVGVGVFAWKGANELDAAFDTIQIKTGATGDELIGLQDDFKAVFSSVPTDAATASSAMAALNTRLGLSGDALVDLSKPLLEASRILGGDATQNAELFSRVMGDWGIPVEEAAGALDMFFSAGQQTGIGMDDLMGKVVQFGAPLRLMGFNLTESTALFGKWEKEGVNAELVMGSLRIAAGKFADSGKPLRESLLSTFDSIKNNENASEALALAMDVFGARAGPDMAAAIREGRFEIDDLVASLGESEGAIMSTAFATADWGEKLDVMKNKATLALAPLGGLLMDLASDMLDSLMPVVEDLTGWLGVNLPIAIGVLSEFWTNTLLPAIQVVWEWLSGTLIPFLQNVILPWLQKYVPLALQTLSQFWQNILLPAIQAVWKWISGTLIPFFQNVVVPWLAVNIPKAIEVLKKFWESVLLPAIQAVWAWLSNTLIPFFQNVVFPWLAENIPAAIQTLTNFWTNTLLPAVTGVWNFLKDDLFPTMVVLSDFLGAVFGLAVEALSVIWEQVLYPALKIAGDYVSEKLQPIIETLTSYWRDTFGPDLLKVKQDVLDAIPGVFQSIRDKVQWVIDKIAIFTEALKGLKLPDWLTPGSPTPFEWGLRGIADAMDDLNARSLPKFALGLSNAGVAGRSMSSVTNNYNITGQYAYQSEVSILREARLMEMMYG